MTISIGDWYRTCQECGYEQTAREPDKSKPLTNSYIDTKCRACGSRGSLDYGTVKVDDDYDWTEEYTS